MGSAQLSDLGTEIVIPVCAVISIVFSLVQLFLVSRVKVSPEHAALSPSSNNGKIGYNDFLIEEEEGINDHKVVAKCTDIQNAIHLRGLKPRTSKDLFDGSGTNFPEIILDY